MFAGKIGSTTALEFTLPRLNQLAAALLGLFGLSLGAQARSHKARVVQRALRQSVRVEVVAGGKVARAASGVIVASEGTTSYVLTNAHVVERKGLPAGALFEVVIERPRLHRLRGRIVAEGHAPEDDLALLQVEGERLTAAPLATEEQVDVGDDVVVIGAPYGRALSVSSGIVSQLETDEGDSHQQRGMKTDAPIGYGASGGGVFEVPSGRLVGLVEGYRTAKVNFGGLSNDDFSFDVPMPGETFLAPPTQLRAFLVRAGIGKLAGLREGSGREPKLVSQGASQDLPLAQRSEPRPRSQ